MGKRVKKPAVIPELARQWLRRYEEQGESPPQIAKADGYDVRTVRKQIELARQEREVREARFMVLRNALERHYEDLVNYARDLDVVITQSSQLANAKSNRLWSALRQHLPRSPLWKAIDRMERLNEEAETLEKRAEKALQDRVERKSPVSFATEEGALGLRIPALTKAMMYHLEEAESLRLLEFQTTGVREGLTDVSYGGRWCCAIIPNNQVPAVKKFIADLMTDVSQGPECEDMRRILAERRRVINAIREELATIILRRVVPGRCKYCPL